MRSNGRATCVRLGPGLQRVFIRHADRDHIGNLDAVLAACPQATVITTSIGVTCMLADGPPHLDRLRWVNHGETLDVGDRVLAAMRPPMWDASETRGLFDPKTGVYWGADCFGTMLTHPVTHAAQLDPLFWEDSLIFETGAHTEWHTMLTRRSSTPTSSTPQGFTPQSSRRPTDRFSPGPTSSGRST